MIYSFMILKYGHLMKFLQLLTKKQMHFVDFYNCWNGKIRCLSPLICFFKRKNKRNYGRWSYLLIHFLYNIFFLIIENQKEENTQVFICCDKPKDANLIVISFRGTEPFNAQDWSTDFDFSWYEVEKVGKIHVGFLEAMGLGSRGDPSTFKNHLRRKLAGFFHLDQETETMMMEWAKKSAYYAVSMKLKSLLTEHRNAKFVVTGHSLGGALAILFPCVLVIQEETEIIRRLLNIYTFGQPRIGDAQLGKFMEAHLNFPANRYYRVVYCNDMVPRVPFDDKVFAFKHFGVCLYYDSRYFGQVSRNFLRKSRQP